MRFRRRLEEIEAAKYSDGMEDGFSCIPFVMECQRRDSDGNYKQCDTCKLDIKKKPYLNYPSGKEFINADDWIITECDGKKWCCDSETFALMYEMV